MAYKNHEGYSDPTAGAAMGQIIREYRQRRKAEWTRQYEIRNHSKVYIITRNAGNDEKNHKNLIRCCRFAIKQKCMPIVSSLIYSRILRDNVPEEREIGTCFGMELLALCDEVWIFTNRIGFSSEMRAEEHEARRLNKPIRYFDMEVIP